MVSCDFGGDHSPYRETDLAGLSTPERFDAIVAISNPLQRTAQWLEFLADLQPSDAQEVDKRFDESVGRVDEAAAILFGSWWAGVDPLAALSAVGDWPWDGRRLGVRVVLRRWAADDPKAAFGILREMPIRDEVVLQNATRALATGFFEGDPVPGKPEVDYVLSVIKPLDDPKSRKVAFDALISGMLTSWGVDESLRFVDELVAGPHANIRHDFSRRFVSQFIAVDPERAVDWVAKFTPQAERKHLRRRLGARWARFDGPSAMIWAAGQPAGEGRHKLVEHTYRNFMSSDSPAAMDWMLERVEETALTPALPMFLARFARRQPEQAAEWITLLSDARGRKVAAMNVARAWLRADESAARDWLPGSGLSPRDQAVVLREVQAGK